MQPAGRLEPQPWMTAPETRAVVEALRAGGADARFVGGCVRDTWLKRPVKDIDIATHAPPETVLRILEDAGIRAIPTGLAHGTVTAVVGLLKPPFAVNPDPTEVDEVFEVPLTVILGPDMPERHSREVMGVARFFYAFPYEQRYIWGATAGMLVNLRDVLAEAR